MEQISTKNAEQTKAFCHNHKERNILLVGSNKNTGVVFEAELTLDEFKAVCDFITANLRMMGESRMKLEVDKTYVTVKGSKVRIICTDVKSKSNEFPVVGLMSVENEELVSLYTADGHYASSKKNCGQDIVAEYSFWNDVEVNTPILVKELEEEDWCKRHFAKYENGKVYAWTRGNTSWSAFQKPESWDYAKLEEEVK